MGDGPDLLLFEGCLGNLVSVQKRESSASIYMCMLFFVTGVAGMVGHDSFIVYGD